MTDRSLPVPGIATSDVCDALGAAAQVVALDLRDYGGRIDFNGPAQTIKTLDDNSEVRAQVESPGEGRVLVVDGEASRNNALVGGNLAKLAADNGWAGIIVNGYIRDQHELIAENVGVKALGSCPRKGQKTGVGQVGVEISIGGVTINPGDWVTADADGVVVTREKPDA